MLAHVAVLLCAIHAFPVHDDECLTHSEQESCALSVLQYRRAVLLSADTDKPSDALPQVESDAECGGSPYDLSLQGCCSGAAYTLNTHGCCGNAFVYSSSKQGCCENARVYTYAAERCILSSEVPSPSEKNQSRIDAPATPATVLCGGDAYNPALQGCCNDSVFTLSAQGCCGGTLVYSSSKQGCCEDTRVFEFASEHCMPSPSKARQSRDEKSHAASAAVQCGDGIYDPARQGCCNGVAYTLSAQGCCGNASVASVYSFSEQGCCEETRVFNTSSEQCMPSAESHSQPAEPQFECSASWPPPSYATYWKRYCKSRRHMAWAFSPSCKSGGIKLGAVSSRSAGMSALKSCNKRAAASGETCHIFDMDGRGCHRQRCGNKIYDSALKGCCAGRHSYDLATEGCCGGIVHNAQSQGCCRGKIYSKRLRSCCGDVKLFDSRTHGCCLNDGPQVYKFGTHNCCYHPAGACKIPKGKPSCCH